MSNHGRFQFSQDSYASGNHSVPQHSSAYPRSFTSVESTGEFDRRADWIKRNHDYLVSVLSADDARLEEIMDRIDRHLPGKEAYNLKEIPLGYDQALKIIHLVEQNISSDLYGAFMNCLYNIPEVCETLNLTGTAPRQHSSHSGADGGISPEEIEKRSNVLDINYHYLLMNLRSEEILNRILPFLSQLDQEELGAIKVRRDLARRIIALVQHNVNSSLYVRFLDCLFEIQPEIYEKLMANTESQLDSGYSDNSKFMDSSHPPTLMGQSVTEPLQGAGSLSYPNNPLNYNRVVPEKDKKKKEGKRGFWSSIGWSSIFGSSKKASLETQSACSLAVQYLEEDSGCDELEDNENQMTNLSDLNNAEEGSVKEIKLFQPIIEDNDVPSLCKALAIQVDISSFHINGEKLGNESAVRLLSSLRHIHNLNELSFIGVVWFEKEIDKFIEFLSDKKNLTQLSLNQCKFSHGSWRRLAEALWNMPKLNNISLNDTAMTDFGAELINKALQEKRGLKKLHVAKNEISDIGLYHLAACINNNVHLEHLSLARNQITDEGAKYLAAVNQYERTPCDINLADNQLSTNGAWTILTTWATTSHKKHKFNLDRNQIRVESIASTENTVSMVGNIRNRNRVEVLVKRLINGESYRYINLSGLYLKDEDIKTLCAVLCTNGQLEKLDISGNSLTDQSLPFLTEMFHRCEKLNCVNIQGNKLTDFKMVEIFNQHLSSMRQGGEDGPLILGNKFREILDKANEGSLLLDNVVLGENDIPILFRIIETAPLREIKIENCHLRKSDIKSICEHVITYSNITEVLLFRRNYLKGDAVKVLADSFPKPSRYNTRSKDTSQITKGMIVLKQIVLCDNGVTHNSIKYLVDTIFMCPYLTHINLANNTIGKQGSKHIQQYLAGNPPLRSLCVAGNNIGNEGAHFLCTPLVRVNTRIKHLSLANNMINKGITYVAEVLVFNRNLEVIDLSENSFGGSIKEFSQLCIALEKNCTLKTLKLHSNFINDVGIRHLAKSLQSNAGLCKIDISKNQIQTKALEAMLSAVACRRIDHLDISESIRNDDDIYKICQSLRSGDVNLSYLGLRNAQISVECVLTLAESLGVSKQNTSFQNQKEAILDISGMEVPKKIQRGLAKIRMKYHSPRCAFDNVNGEKNFFNSPF